MIDTDPSKYPSHSISESFSSACDSLFGTTDYCKQFNMNYDTSALKVSSTARAACEELGACFPGEKELWKQADATSDIDIRVAKVHGPRGYDKIRVSAISNETINSELFSYSQPFKYRWTSNTLNTGVLSVTPGQKTSITIQDQTFEIYVPEENSPVRGALFADPCYANDYVWCTYRDTFNTFNRSTELLNAISAHGDTDFWMLLGDNFYDQTGEITANWFNALSSKTKSMVYGTVPGNHDFWIMSAPLVWMPKQDQLGNGFMQWNGQDVASSVYSDGGVLTEAYDFSNDPDDPNGDAHNLPPAGDFFWYYKLGNVGFIAYSGGHSYEEMLPYFEESCEFMTSADPEAVLLLGHWNSPGLGCPKDMFVPATYHEILSLPACAPIADRMKYFMGHEHCNKVVEKDVGFMIAGQGMTASLPCGGNFGFPVVDTYGGNFTVYFFDIAQVDEYDNYDSIIDCITQYGVSSCYHLATVWTDIPFAQ